jgi:hypothetical protein
MESHTYLDIIHRAMEETTKPVKDNNLSEEENRLIFISYITNKLGNDARVETIGGIKTAVYSPDKSSEDEGEDEGIMRLHSDEDEGIMRLHSDEDEGIMRLHSDEDEGTMKSKSTVMLEIFWYLLFISSVMNLLWTSLNNVNP